MSDFSTSVCVAWREVDGKKVQFVTPREADPLTSPLYVRHTGSNQGWGVYHANSGLAIRTCLKRKVAIRFMLAIESLTDWSLPASKIVAGQSGITAQLDYALRNAQEQPT